MLGEEQLRTELALLVGGRTVNGQAIVVVRVLTIEEALTTQLLFVGVEGQARFAGFRQALIDRPILIVGETQGFALASGQIGFVVQGEKLRFEINVANAERAGLRISSQLQKLAIPLSPSQ